MKRGVALRGGHLRLVVGLLAAGTLSACGGRSESEDASLFDDGKVVGVGEVLEVTNGASTALPGTPPVGTTPVAPGISTGVVPPPVSKPPIVPPSIPPTRPIPPPSVMPPVPGTVMPLPPETEEPDFTSEPWVTSDPVITTSDPTTSDPTSDATTDPTTTDTTTTTEPPPPEPIDPLHPPDGVVALGLPLEYANVEWYDIYGAQCGHNGWSSSYSCQVSFDCNEGSGYTECGLDGAGTWQCGCRDFVGHYQAVTVPDSIVAESNGDACRIGSAVCLTDAPPTSPAVCSDTQSQYETYCYRARSCSETLASSYGEFTLTEERAAVSCDSWTDANVGSCGCNLYPYESPAFEIGAPRDAQCAAALDICETGLDAGSESAVECSWYSRRFSDFDCQNGYHCAQTGTAAGVAVTTKQDMSVSCSGGDGSWSCTCDDWYNYTTFAADDSTAACDLAGEHCRAALGNLF